MADILLRNYFEEVLNDAQAYYDPSEPWPYDAQTREEYINASVNDLYPQITEAIETNPEVEQYLVYGFDPYMFILLNPEEYDTAYDALYEVFRSWLVPDWFINYEESLDPELITPFGKFLMVLRQMYALHS